MRISKLGTVSLIAAFVICLSLVGSAAGQEPEQKAEPTSPAQTNQPIAKSETEQLRQTIKELSDQIYALSTEVKRLRHSTELNSDAMKLILYEDRLARVEDTLDSAMAQKSELENEEHQIIARQNNINGEVLIRGGLNREDSERAIRDDLQRQLDNIHARQSTNQRRLSELQSEASNLKSAIESLSKKVDNGSNGIQQDH